MWWRDCCRWHHPAARHSTGLSALEIALETGIGETRSAGHVAAKAAEGLVQLGLLREAKRKSDNSMPIRAFAVTDNWLSQEDR